MLTASGITKRYGAVQALVETNLVVRSHEVVALVGDNGAGKSTLIKWRRAASSTGTVIDPERRQPWGTVSRTRNDLWTATSRMAVDGSRLM